MGSGGRLGVGRHARVAFMFITLVIIISVAQAQQVKFFVKLHHTWSGTVFFPDGTKQLIGTFPKLEAGSGYRLELEHQDSLIVLELKDATMASDIDLDLTGIKVVSRGKDHFIGIPQDGWQALADQFASGTVIISFPTTGDKLYSCTKENPVNCTTARRAPGPDRDGPCSNRGAMVHRTTARRPSTWSRRPTNCLSGRRS